MRFLHRVLQAALTACMVAIVIVTSLGVVFRYFLNSPLFWTDEIARYALVWMTFLGGALLVRHSDGHVKVDFFTDRMRRSMRRVAIAVSTAVEIAIVSLVVIGGFIWIQASTRAASAAAGIPMVLIYAVIPLSGLVALIFIAERFVGHRKAGSGDG